MLCIIIIIIIILHIIALTRKLYISPITIILLYYLLLFLFPVIMVSLSTMAIDMEICESTEKDSERWWKERSKRITASKFGRVMSARSDESLRKLSEDIHSGPSGLITVGLYSPGMQNGHGGGGECY